MKLNKKKKKILYRNRKKEKILSKRMEIKMMINLPLVKYKFQIWTLKSRKYK